MDRKRTRVHVHNDNSNKRSKISSCFTNITNNSDDDNEKTMSLYREQFIHTLHREAIDAVHKYCPPSRPNRHIIQLCDKIIEFLKYESCSPTWPIASQYESLMKIVLDDQVVQDVKIILSEMRKNIRNEQQQEEQQHQSATAASSASSASASSSCTFPMDPVTTALTAAASNPNPVTVMNANTIEETHLKMLKQKSFLPVFQLLLQSSIFLHEKQKQELDRTGMNEIVDHLCELLAFGDTSSIHYVILLNPNLFVLLIIHMSKVLAMLENWDLTLTILEGAFKMRNHVDFLMARAEIMRKLNQYDQEADCYTKIIEMADQAPNVQYQAYMLRGSAHMQNQSTYFKALSDMEKASSLKSDDPQLYLPMGTLNLALNRLEIAMKCFAKTIELDPTCSDAHTELGKCFINLNQYDEAIEQFNKAIAIDCTCGQAFYTRGCCYFLIAKYEEALHDCLKALELTSNNSSLENALAIYQLSTICYKLERKVEALSFAKLAQSINPLPLIQRHYRCLIDEMRPTSSDPLFGDDLL